MYSVVMMMAMTAGADVPDCHRRHGCSGCSGAAVSVACYGGAACSGGRHHRHGHRHRGHGCSGVTCSGGAVYGCSGGAVYGCSGGAVYGCSGGAVYGCSGGAVYGGGGAYGGAGYVAPPPHHGPGGSTLPPPVKGKGGKKGGTTPPPATDEETTGTIQVNLPAGARLTVDGVPTASNAASRLLVTPDLQPGYEYYYTLRAETVRDGQTVAQTQRVAVRSGEQTQVSFDLSTTGVASNR